MASIDDPAQRQALAHPSLREALRAEALLEAQRYSRRQPWPTLPPGLGPAEFSAQVSAVGEFSTRWIEFCIPQLYEGLGAADRPFRHYLEIGSYEGLSTCWMARYLAAQGGAGLSVVDPFTGNLEHQGDANKDYEARYDRNVARFIAGPPPRKFKMTSARALEDLRARGERFDLIYVDGSHQALDVLVDASLGWRLLETGGVLVFDDYFWMHEQTPRNVLHAVNAFLDTLGGGYRVLKAYYQVILQKTA